MEASHKLFVSDMLGRDRAVSKYKKRLPSSGQETLTSDWQGGDVTGHEGDLSEALGTECCTLVSSREAG